MKRTRTFSTPFLNELIGFGLLLLLWSLLSLFFPPYVVPSPLEVMQAAPQYLHGEFLSAVLLTSMRILVGFLIALALGTALGALVADTVVAERLGALMQAFQVIPAITVGVILVIIFGIGSMAPIVLIALMTLPVVFLNVVQALRFTDPELAEYLDSIHASKATRFSALRKPQLIRVTQHNLVLGFSLATKIAVMGEFIGAQDGVGYLMNRARIVFEMKEVFFYLVFFVLLTLAFQALVELLYQTTFKKYSYGD